MWALAASGDSVLSRTTLSTRARVPPTTSRRCAERDAKRTIAREYGWRGPGGCGAGGTRSFGAGGYAGTKIEELLPVRVDPRPELQAPPVSLVIVILTFVKDNLPQRGDLTWVMRLVPVVADPGMDWLAIMCTALLWK